MSGNLKMTVNVSLCGSIPRSQMNFCSSKQRLRERTVKRDSGGSMKSLGTVCPTELNAATKPPSNVKPCCLPRQVSQETITLPSQPPIIDPPSWAVAARGEARLEPVCESLNVQSPVDLTSKAVFRIGRSQNSDVQLLHCTSSRRHAILFHHPNGSCYVVDCGSAHGTFVNGTRVKTEMQTPNSDGSSKSCGIILPHRVKKGALIRFGGPGAPSFILKSFSVSLESLVHNLEEEKKKKRKETSFKDTIRVDESNESSLLGWDRTNNSSSNNSSKSRQTLIPSASSALLTLNTRLNAVGSAASSLSLKNVSLSLTTARLQAQLQPLQSCGISFLKKRSIVSFDEESDVDYEDELHCCKKMKMMTTTTTTTTTTNCNEQPSFQDIGSDIAIVSPSRQKSTLVFDFDQIQRPVVSPTPIEVNELIPKERNGLRSILSNPLSLPSSRRIKRRVMFSEKEPDVYE